MPRSVGTKELVPLIRSHWALENGLHYTRTCVRCKCRRDETLREDWCHLKLRQASRAMAVINKLSVRMVLQLRWTNLQPARRYFDAHLHKTQCLVLFQLSDFWKALAVESDIIYSRFES